MASNIGDLAGKTLGTCTLEKLIGQGGMGAVYLARQTRPARNVAVKVLLPNLAPNSQVYQEFLARFRREADVIARLEHVNIMPIYEYGEQDGLAYLVMPYLTGGSLRDSLAKHGPLPLQEVVKYSNQAAAALDYAHALGVIHRDLKPANFLLHADGRLVLADFGIARIMDETKAMGQTLTTTGMLIGTPEYMAPEMVRGEQIDYRADIYELGIVLYQVLSGRAPFSGSTPLAVAVMHVQDPLPRLHPTNPTVPLTVDSVIQKATAKRREDRYTSASEMARALQQAYLKPDNEYQVNRWENSNSTTIPTFPPAPHVPPSPTHSKPEVQQALPAESSLPTWANTPSAPAGYTPQPAISYQAVPGSSHTSTSKKMLFSLSILFALVLLFGGIIIGIQFNRETARPNAPLGPRQDSIPLGASLYATSSPGPGCDTGGGIWENFDRAEIECLGSSTRITNTASKRLLQGLFLTILPGQTYPSDYVVQAQIVLDNNSTNKCGIYFRNQPGSQLGAYTFFIQSDGTWSANVYDNTTGTESRLTEGNMGSINGSVMLAVVVKGPQFHFYVNGRLLGTTSDNSYTSGTAGLVVDMGASVVVRHFELYATAP